MFYNTNINWKIIGYIINKKRMLPMQIIYGPIIKSAEVWGKAHIGAFV